MADVHLHIGLPKTGTTTIQGMLDAAAPRLADEGVLIPGGGHRAQRTAVYDLLGQRVRGDLDEVVAGALDRLLAEVAAYDGPHVVVSEEELSLCRPRHVRRLLRGLSGHRVFVVVGVRDLARTLVSAWQQRIVNGGTTPWPDFIGSVRGDPTAPPREGIAFWRGHDLFRVVDTWTAYVPPDRVRLVTVPPPGADASVLLARFCEAAALPGWTAASAPAARRNVALGAAELEAIRRMNRAVEGRLNASQHRFVIEAGIRSRLADGGGRPLVLPAEHRAWARAQGEQLVAEVERRGLQVVGPLTDLVPQPVGGSDARPPDAVRDDELLTATEAALASLALDHGRLFRRYRRDVAAREGRVPGPAELLGSRVRAGGFGVGRWVLRRSDDHGLAARLGHRYLRRLTRARRVG
ncbi:hypothetical protein [Nocardioides sp.]|uniref:hypothetical protein n=1 Tax=Nocardioides sp. TaxID=35761 RepID=UPI0035B2B0E4